MAETPETEQAIEIIKPISITPKQYAQSTTFSPLNEPLGAFIITFAELESKLTDTINALLSINAIEGIALEDLMQSLTTRIKLFHTLASIKVPGLLTEEISRTNGLLGQLHKSNNYRNDYIHGNWTTVHPDGSFGKVRYKADKGLTPIESVFKVSVDEIWKAQAHVFRTALRLQEWRLAVSYPDHPEIWPSPLRGRLEEYNLRQNRVQVKIVFRVELPQQI